MIIENYQSNFYYLGGELMSDGFICKDCNYTSDSAGNCPHCDMPLDPIDVDDVTGEVEQYDPNAIEDVEEKTADNPDYEPDPNRKTPIEEDELDEIIDNKNENKTI